ncbi:MAG: hypothetical protein J7L42_00710 [Elusimicrobia bacterium]|nr:hypothetical protein [Elusimicrobiota bacterium]
MTKHYIIGIILGILLFFGIYSFIKRRIYIPPERQEEFATIFYSKAKKLEKKGDSLSAIKEYWKVVKKCPLSSRAELSLFRIFEIYEKKDEKKMVKIANYYLKKFAKKRGSEVACRVGKYFLSLNDFKNAEKFFKYAVNVASSPEFTIKAYEMLSEVYYRKGKYRDVVSLNEKIISKLGKKVNVDFFRILSLKCYWKMQDYKNAYNEAKKIGNTSLSFVKNEILFWKAIVKFEPDNAKAVMSLGDVYFRMGFRNQAYDLWDRAYRLNPDDPEIKKRHARK